MASNTKADVSTTIILQIDPLAQASRLGFVSGSCRISAGERKHLLSRQDHANIEYRIIHQQDIFAPLQSPGARQHVLTLFEEIRPVQPVWLFF
jgi:hypothetical protein